MLINWLGFPSDMGIDHRVLRTDIGKYNITNECDSNAFATAANVDPKLVRRLMSGKDPKISRTQMEKMSGLMGTDVNGYYTELPTPQQPPRKKTPPPKVSAGNEEVQRTSAPTPAPQPEPAPSPVSSTGSPFSGISVGARYEKVSEPVNHGGFNVGLLVNDIIDYLTSPENQVYTPAGFAKKAKMRIKFVEALVGLKTVNLEEATVERACHVLPFEVDRYKIPESIDDVVSVDDDIDTSTPDPDNEDAPLLPPDDAPKYTQAELDDRSAVFINKALLRQHVRAYLESDDNKVNTTIAYAAIMDVHPTRISQLLNSTEETAKSSIGSVRKFTLPLLTTPEDYIIEAPEGQSKKSRKTKANLALLAADLKFVMGDKGNDVNTTGDIQRKTSYSSARAKKLLEGDTTRMTRAAIDKLAPILPRSVEDYYGNFLADFPAQSSREYTDEELAGKSKVFIDAALLQSHILEYIALDSTDVINQKEYAAATGLGQPEISKFLRSTSKRTTIGRLRKMTTPLPTSIDVYLLEQSKDFREAEESDAEETSIDDAVNTSEQVGQTPDVPASAAVRPAAKQAHSEPEPVPVVVPVYEKDTLYYFIFPQFTFMGEPVENSNGLSLERACVLPSHAITKKTIEDQAPLSDVLETFYRKFDDSKGLEDIEHFNPIGATASGVLEYE